MLAHGAARDGHGPVDLAVALELVEEDRHELGSGLHADLTLHRHHGRHAGLGQARAKGGEGTTVGAQGVAIAAAGALAGGEHDQARALV